MNVKKILFTALYTGYSPAAPGTVATGLAAAIFAAEFFLFGDFCTVINGVMTAVLFVPAIFLCGAGEVYFGVKDPPQVVLDEVLGYWVSILFHPFSWHVLIGAFLLFRLTDILKPYPAGRLENIRGGFGILIDDVIAGVYTNIILTVFLLIIGFYKLPAVM